MAKPTIALSNTATFFSGDAEKIFSKAKQFGFTHIELLPYRWDDPDRIIKLASDYNITIAGIHLPQWWNLNFWQAVRSRPGLKEKLFTPLWSWYMGRASTSPGIALARKLKQKGSEPYLLLHANLPKEMGKTFVQIAKELHVVLENVPSREGSQIDEWNPVAIERKLRQISATSALVLDPDHYLQSIRRKKSLPLLEMYKQIRPEVIHIGYNYDRQIHVLPAPKEQIELKQIFRIYLPRYIVIETNPLVNPGDGKRMMEKLIKEI